MLRPLSFSFLLVVSAFLIVGCGSTTKSAPETQPNESESESVCVPQVCDPYVCGEGSDGCGGQRSCGACPDGRDGRYVVGQRIDFYIKAHQHAYRQIQCNELELPKPPRFDAVLTLTGPDGTTIEHPFAFVGEVTKRAGRNSAGHCIANAPTGAHVSLPPQQVAGRYELELLSPDLEAVLPFEVIRLLTRLVP